MSRTYKSVTQNLQTEWDQYELSENEPKIKRNYDISPELEEGLFDHSYFLKRRVWRQMKQVQKHNSSQLHSSVNTNTHFKKHHLFHHRPARMFHSM